MDNQEYSFVLWVKEIELRYGDMPKDQRIRVERWLDKLACTDSNYSFVKDRNMYAKLLLDMVFAKRLTYPFHVSPPEGSLPRFPNHLKHSLKNAIGAHETHYWRELYKKIITTNNPALEEGYERSLERTGELEAELCDLKSRYDLQELKIKELLSANINSERSRVELSESLLASTAEMEGLSSKLTAEEAQRDALEEELSHAKLQLLDLADKIDSETEMNETLTRHVEDERKQVEELADLLASEEACTKRLLTDLTHSQTAQTELQRKVVTLESSIAELRQEGKEREGRLEALNQIISSQREASSVLQSLLDESRLTTREVTAKLTEHQSAHEQTQQELCECQEELRSEREATRRLEGQLERCYQDHAQQICDLKQRLVEYQHDSDHAKEQLRQTLPELAAAKEEVRQLLADKEQANAEAHRSAADMAAKLLDAEGKLTALREEADKCRQDLSANMLSLSQRIQESDVELEKVRKEELERRTILEQRLQETINCSADMNETQHKKIAAYEELLKHRDHEMKLVMEHTAEVGKMLLESEDMRSQVSRELDDTKAKLDSTVCQLDSLQEAVKNEREKREILDNHMYLLQQDTDRANIQKSTEVLSRFKLQRSLSETTERTIVIGNQLKEQLRINEELTLQLQSSDATVKSLTLRCNEVYRLLEQRRREIDELEAKLVHVEAARAESLNSCLTLAKENQLIERRYDDLYQAYKSFESYNESLRQSLRVLEEARLKSVHNLEDLIEGAFQDMMDGSTVLIPRS